MEEMFYCRFFVFSLWLFSIIQKHHVNFLELVIKKKKISELPQLDIDKMCMWKSTFDCGQILKKKDWRSNLNNVCPGVC